MPELLSRWRARQPLAGPRRKGGGVADYKDNRHFHFHKLATLVHSWEQVSQPRPLGPLGNLPRQRLGGIIGIARVALQPYA